jgi:hypothetical protein
MPTGLATCSRMVLRVHLVPPLWNAQIALSAVLAIKSHRTAWLDRATPPILASRLTPFPTSLPALLSHPLNSTTPETSVMSGRADISSSPHPPFFRGYVPTPPLLLSSTDNRLCTVFWRPSDPAPTPTSSSASPTFTVTSNHSRSSRAAPTQLRRRPHARPTMPRVSTKEDKKSSSKATAAGKAKKVKDPNKPKR